MHPWQAKPSTRRLPALYLQLTKAVAVGSTTGSTSRAYILPGEVSLPGGLREFPRASTAEVSPRPMTPERKGFVHHTHFNQDTQQS